MSESFYKKIGFIGAGNMGGAIINGLINSNYPATHILISYPSAGKNKKFAHLNTAHESSDTEFVVANSDVIFLCVKPQIIEKVCKGFSHLVDSSHHMIISVAAGVTIKKLEVMFESTGKSLRIVRCMMNTAALIGSSCSVFSHNGYLTDEDNGLVIKILNGTGPCMGELKDDSMDAAMAVLSCGIAYHFMMTVRQIFDLYLFVFKFKINNKQSKTKLY